MRLSECINLAKDHVSFFATETISDKKMELEKFKFIINKIEIHFPSSNLSRFANPLYIYQDNLSEADVVHKVHSTALYSISTVLDNLIVMNDIEVMSNRELMILDLKIKFDIFSQLSTNEKISVLRSLIIFELHDFFFEKCPNPMELPLSLDLAYLLIRNISSETSYIDQYINRFSLVHRVFLTIFGNDRDAIRKLRFFNANTEDVNNVFTLAISLRYRELDEWDIVNLCENRIPGHFLETPRGCHEVIAKLLLSRNFSDLETLRSLPEYDKAYREIIGGKAVNIFANINGLNT